MKILSIFIQASIVCLGANQLYASDGISVGTSYGTSGSAVELDYSDKTSARALGVSISLASDGNKIIKISVERAAEELSTKERIASYKLSTKSGETGLKLETEYTRGGIALRADQKNPIVNIRINSEFGVSKGVIKNTQTGEEESTPLYALVSALYGKDKIHISTHADFLLTQSEALAISAGAKISYDITKRIKASIAIDHDRWAIKNQSDTSYLLTGRYFFGDLPTSKGVAN